MVKKVTEKGVSQKQLKPIQYKLVPRAHVSFGQRQDMELWNNQFPKSKILGLPVSRRMHAMV